MKKNKILIVPKQIVTANKKSEILRDSAVEITNGRISKIDNLENFEFGNYEEVYNFPRCTLIPGFIQTHVHLCQTLFRGLADDLELLDWLQKRIFPYENAHSKKSLSLSAQLGIHELQTSGTTTILDMGTMRHQEVIFEELNNSKMRAFSGKCMIDENELYPESRESTKDSLAYSSDLAGEFHDINGRVKYAFAPRFVLSCTEQLLKETVEMVKNFEGSIYHSHSSENKNEIESVRKKYGMENIEYFDSIGALSDKTVLAHCIHLNNGEIDILKKTKTRIAHCPSANLKLGSGIANVPRYLKEKISVSLGADGPPCNNNLSIFTEMRLAGLIQKPIHGPTVMDALTIFKLATIEGAKVSSIDDETGSIELNKKADLVLLDLEKPQQSLLDNDNNIYSDIVYSCGKENVMEVMIDGYWVVRDSRSEIYDEEKIYDDGKSELVKLLNRVDVS